tara:strand:+ start:2815 stop:3303 length:489 start_codon:yes stop_codon:yes gene_type:complete
MLLFKRISTLFALLLLGACGFEPAYTSSTTAASIRDAFVLKAPTDRGSYQFYHNLKRQVSDNRLGRYVLSYSISTNTTNAAIDADGRSHRSILKGKLSYKITLKKTGEMVKSNEINVFTSYSALASSVASDASGRDATKRLMKILSDQLVDDLLLAAAKGEI